MSFFSELGVLTRDLWPDNIGRPAVDTRQIPEMPLHSVIPDDAELLGEFFCLSVAGKLNKTTTVYRLSFDDLIMPSLNGVLPEPVFRIQGFVTYKTLGPFGNWNGHIGHCPKAAQRLGICGEHGSLAFPAQMRQIGIVREFVDNAIGSQPAHHDRGDAHMLKFHREVFTKVRPGQDVDALHVIPNTEDPLRRWSKVKHMWYVAHRVRSGYQGSDGKLNPAHATTIRVGDFVDIAATMKVVVSKNEGRTESVVQWEVRELFVLKTVAELKELGVGMAGVSDDVAETVIVPAGSGFDM